MASQARQFACTVVSERGTRKPPWATGDSRRRSQGMCAFGTRRGIPPESYEDQ